MSKLTRRHVVMLIAGITAMIAIALGMLGGSGAYAAVQKTVTPDKPAVVVPDFLTVAPNGHPNLASGGLLVKTIVRYACSSANGFTETSAEGTVVIAQGANALSGTFVAQCDGLAHQINGFQVTGPIALSTGLARAAGLLQQVEIGTTGRNNPKSDTTTDQSIVNLV